jgi:hypothetical protein
MRYHLKGWECGVSLSVARENGNKVRFMREGVGKKNNCDTNGVSHMLNINVVSLQQLQSSSSHKLSTPRKHYRIKFLILHAPPALKLDYFLLAPSTSKNQKNPQGALNRAQQATNNARK